MRRKTQCSKVTKVYYSTTKTNSSGNVVKTLVECVTQKTMVAAIIQENLARFTRCTQAATAYFSSSLLQHIGILCQGPKVEDILKGNYSPEPDVDPHTADFLSALTIDPVPDELHTASTHIIAKENSRAWKAQKAGTALEPSHLSFPHHIIAAHSGAFSEVDAALRSAPYEMGWSPEDWEVITDFQLLKQLGVYEVERMRTIALMAALFNMNNKKLGRDTMQVAEKAKVLAS
jgi:hypothetical protein